MLVVVAVGLVVGAVHLTAAGSGSTHGRAPAEPEPVTVAPPAAPHPTAAATTAATATEQAAAPRETAPTAPPPRREVTAAAPLRVWLAGDSMWEAAGPALAARLEASGPVDTTVDVRYSSGLTRPDFFDWTARVAEVLAARDPDVVVVFLGANDAQPLVDGAQVHQPGTEGFSAVYRSRTERLMQQLASDGRQVLWVGLPVMRPAGYDERMRLLAAVQEASAHGIPGVTFVGTRSLFTDDDGGYAAALPDASGEVRALRGADGIHLSVAGADRLAEHLLPRILTPWGLAP